MAEDFGLLGELCECSGIPGREGRLREIVLRELEPLVDAVEVDKLGNVVGHKKATKGRQPLKLMLAAHMDEIGFVVSHVDDRGLLRLVPLGGHDPRNMVAQRVTVAGKRGDLTGILYPGVKPPHLQTAGDGEKKLAIPDFFVDLCLPPTRVKRDVEVGTMVTIQREFSEIGNGLSCKSIDNRVAIFVMIEAVRRAKFFGFDVYAVATVQEEIGLRGVGVSTFGIEPDVGVAIDTTIAADIPGVPEHERVTAMGGGCDQADGLVGDLSPGPRCSDAQPGQTKENQASARDSAARGYGRRWDAACSGRGARDHAVPPGEVYPHVSGTRGEGGRAGRDPVVECVH